jgi:carbamoyltransferase
VTQWLGFRPESGEGKTMGLAAYGRPESPNAAFTRGLIAHAPRGLLRVDVGSLGFPWGRQRLFGDAFVRALGPAREADGEPRDGDADAARGIQDAVEDVFGRVAEQLVAGTAAASLGLAGGLFLNCALNGALLRRLSVPVHPFPVAGDAGAAWGAAAHVHRLRTGCAAAPLTTLELGHDLTPADAEAALAGHRTHRPDDAARAVAALVAEGRLVGVARGRAEFGPRALGARSVLASPKSAATRDLLNRHKGRESWRPLAPVVAVDDRTFFEDLAPSPWMILTFAATAEARARIPGAVHVDGTARVQTVSPTSQPFLHAVLQALAERGEAPVVLNTSFNRRGEPIVNSAREALEAAQAMHLDAVLLADRLLTLAPTSASP